MSGIYISGMEMPKDGTYTIVHIYSDGHVSMPFWGKGMQIVQGINAIPVPPHYDLIDHNALKIAVMDCDAETRIDFLKHAMDCINKAPVVIPSDMPTYEAEEGEG